MDLNGHTVMSTNRTEPTTHTALYQKALGVLIWVAFGVVGVGAVVAGRS